jgi:hypothetical protein
MRTFLASRFRALALLFSTAAVSLAGTGCATVVSSSVQDISISSNPAAADIQVFESPGGPGSPIVASGKSPMGTSLPRDHEYIVLVTAPGYQEVRVKINKTFNLWVLGNLCCGGLIGGAIDLITGAFWKLEPNSVFVNLIPAAPGGGVPGMPPPGTPGGPIMPTPQPGAPPPTYSPSACAEGAELYAVVTAVDSEGQPRSLVVPMVRLNRSEMARAARVERATKASVW